MNWGLPAAELSILKDEKIPVAGSSQAFQNNWNDPNLPLTGVGILAYVTQEEDH